MPDIKVISAADVVAGLKTIVALSGGDVTAALQKLDVPPTDQAAAAHTLKLLLAGDEALAKELDVELASHVEAVAGAKGGGKTAFVVLRKWKIPYGLRLYVSHGIVQDATDIGALAAAVSTVIPGVNTMFITAAAITIAALKVLDRGNGIMITQIPPACGPYIPTPQF